MKKEFKEFLDELRIEVEDRISTCLETAILKAPMSIEQYVLEKLKRRDADKAVDDYHRLNEAFGILSGTGIKKETRETIVSDTMDQKGLILKHTFTRDEIGNIARCVMSNDHITFTALLSEVLNTRVARGYSTAIFGTAPRK